MPRRRRMAACLPKTPADACAAPSGRHHLNCATSPRPHLGSRAPAGREVFQRRRVQVPQDVPEVAVGEEGRRAVVREDLGAVSGRLDGWSRRARRTDWRACRDSKRAAWRRRPGTAPGCRGSRSRRSALRPARDSVHRRACLLAPGAGRPIWPHSTIPASAPAAVDAISLVSGVTDRRDDRQQRRNLVSVWCTAHHTNQLARLRHCEHALTVRSNRLPCSRIYAVRVNVPALRHVHQQCSGVASGITSRCFR